MSFAAMSLHQSQEITVMESWSIADRLFNEVIRVGELEHVAEYACWMLGF
jgi:hypothetical protein